ncbi:MAG: SapC family protein [Alphaproteobacteria bacterium]
MANATDVANGANGANGAPSAQNPKSALPLFYKNPMPLDAKAHNELGLKKNFGFGYTRGINAVPINLIEMPQICHNYPIAFSPDGNATPVAILGLRESENLFLHEDNTWERDVYIPAYVRRYPFIFSEMPQGEQLTLCIDMDEAIIEKGGEQRFFGADGKPTDLANNALEFCKSYHAAAQQTIRFSKALAKSGLLVDREAQINISDNKRINFSGFMIIDEKKLAELSDAVFLELRNEGFLPFIYAHLFSGAQWQRLTKLLNQKMEQNIA